MPVATCHCGATRLELAKAPESATTCTCSFCSKRGTLWSYFELDEVKIAKEESPADYSPSGVNHHHFCATCGCGTYSLTPAWSQEHIDNPSAGIPTKQRIGVNIRLLDDVDVKSIPVSEIDGRNLW
jgi:hypothetical protein